MAESQILGFAVFFLLEKFKEEKFHRKRLMAEFTKSRRTP